jgi:hypothetical protein
MISFNWHCKLSGTKCWSIDFNNQTILIELKFCQNSFDFFDFKMPTSFLVCFLTETHFRKGNQFIFCYNHLFFDPIFTYNSILSKNNKSSHDRLRSVMYEFVAFYLMFLQFIHLQRIYTLRLYDSHEQFKGNPIFVCHVCVPSIIDLNHDHEMVFDIIWWINSNFLYFFDINMKWCIPAINWLLFRSSNFFAIDEL